jgi:hypothetical protein
MLRLILLVIVGMFVAVGVLAVALFHFWGWRGLIAFPFIILVFLWAAIFLIKSLFKNFALSLFTRKARALRGATMSVHSIKSVSKPLEPEPETDDTDEEIEDGKQKETMAVVEAQPVAKVAKTEDPKDYVELDVTITPKAQAKNSFTFWEPSELILTSDKIKSLADLEEKDIGSVHSVEIWNGSAFGPDDPGKYPGEQRLKIIFQVKPGENTAWLHYYNECLGQLNLPVRTIEV